MSDPLRPHRPWPTRLLCPWDSPGKNTGVGCHVLLRGIFLTQGTERTSLVSPGLQANSLPLSHQGSPIPFRVKAKSPPRLALLSLPSPLFRALQAHSFLQTLAHVRLYVWESQSPDLQMVCSLISLQSLFKCYLPTKINTNYSL